jgi:hypothetical protein
LFEGVQGKQSAADRQVGHELHSALLTIELLYPTLVFAATIQATINVFSDPSARPAGVTAAAAAARSRAAGNGSQSSAELLSQQKAREQGNSSFEAIRASSREGWPAPSFVAEVAQGAIDPNVRRSATMPLAVLNAVLHCNRPC